MLSNRSDNRKYYESTNIKLPKIGNNLQKAEKHKTKQSKAEKDKQHKTKQSKV